MGHCLGGQWGLCLHGPHGGWLGSEGGGGVQGPPNAGRNCGTAVTVWHATHCAMHMHATLSVC